MSDIDPVEFGELRGEVYALRAELNALRGDVKELLALANRSRGALWVGMSVAGLVGAAAQWASDKLMR